MLRESCVITDSQDLLNRVHEEYKNKVENKVFSEWEGRGMRCGKFEKKKGKI